MIGCSAAVTMAVVVVCAWLWANQGSMVFFPSSTIERTPADVGLEFETVTLITEDGERLGAWFVPAAESDRRQVPVVLLCHGNAGNVGHRVELLERLNRLGVDTLIFDYRGYGESTGQPSETGLQLDARAAWTHLTDERGVQPGRIIVFGRSLGGAVAADLAAEVEPAGLILDSAFTTLADIAKEAYPWLPSHRILRYRFDTLASVRNASSTVPIAIIHSRDDEMIGFHHGQRLMTGGSERAPFLATSGGHNDPPWEGTPEYGSFIAEFIEDSIEK